MEKTEYSGANDPHDIRKSATDIDGDGDTKEGKSFSSSILLWRMRFAMALKVTPAVKCAGILEFQPSGRRVRPNDCRIEINQVTVVQPCALNGTNGVSIVTCRAGNLFLQVFQMLCKTFVV